MALKVHADAKNVAGGNVIPILLKPQDIDNTSQWDFLELDA